MLFYSKLDALGEVQMEESSEDESKWLLQKLAFSYKFIAADKCAVIHLWGLLF
jgi:predicted metal-dependent TIM-barrel fold hydrolase